MSATDAPTPSMKPEEWYCRFLTKLCPTCRVTKKMKIPSKPSAAIRSSPCFTMPTGPVTDVRWRADSATATRPPPAYHLSRPHACKESCIFKDGLRQRGRESASGRSFESFDLFIQKLGEHILRCNALASRVLYSATALKL